MEFLALFKEFGPWVLLVAFLVWRDWQRETRMAKRIDSQWDALAKLQQRSNDVLRDLTDVLRARPCLSDAAQDYKPHSAPQIPHPAPDMGTRQWPLAVVGGCLLLLLGGCARLSPEQAAQLSQARANARASALTADQAARSTLAAAVAARLEAATANLDLPAPQRSPESLVPAGSPDQAAIDAESRDAAADKDNPPAGVLGWVLGGVGSAALLALGVLRSSPGAFGLLANLAHTALAPRATREMRAIQVQAGTIAERAVAYGHSIATLAEANGLAEQVEALKSEAASEQDALGIRPQIATILAAIKAGHAAPSPDHA